MRETLSPPSHDENHGGIMPRRLGVPPEQLLRQPSRLTAGDSLSATRFRPRPRPNRFLCSPDRVSSLGELSFKLRVSISCPVFASRRRGLGSSLALHGSLGVSLIRLQCVCSTRPLWRCHCSSYLWARALRYRCSGRACVESVFRVMPLTRFSSDAFGVVTISLVIIFHVLAIRCIYQVVYLQVRIHRRDFLQLGYFNGPWITRIFLVIVAIWWSLSEIARLSFLKGRIFSSITWQQNFCKIYILFNLGFSEPSVFLTLVFLLRASLRRRELGTLSQGWNKRTISYVFLYCIPIFVMQIFVDFAGPRFFSEAKNDGRAKKLNYFTKASVLIGDECVCTYPLFSTILLGLFHAVLISYVSYIGMHVFLSVINKQLLQRLYWLVSSVIFSLPVRVLLLGFSVLPQPGNLAYELIVFLAFLVMLFCTVIGILVLVYFPVADLMALRKLEEREVEGMPYDDYFNDSASLVANQSRHDTRRSSDVSTMRGSISFRTMIRDDTPDLDISDETNLSFHGALHIGSPSVSSSTPARPMLPLREVPRY
ncbi:unnamed protein product [Musa acuminata var. zebrina]